MTDPAPASLRVVLADDSGIFRQGLRLLLETLGVLVLDDVAAADAVEQAVARTSPDAVVLDVRFPPTHTHEGIRAAVALRRNHPDLGLLMLSTYAETQSVVALLDEVPTGVGYLLKDRVEDADELVGALRRVASGGIALDGEVVARMMRSRRTADPLERLTARELEVLAHLAQGRSNAGIASLMHLAVKTVEAHVAAIFRQLDLLDVDTDNRRVRAAITYLARPRHERDLGDVSR
jgi:DNA-binding NarL/FixJ family response regulator